MQNVQADYWCVFCYSVPVEEENEQLFPLLDFPKLKSDLCAGLDIRKSRIVQALRWVSLYHEPPGLGVRLVVLNVYTRFVVCSCYKV